MSSTVLVHRAPVDGVTEIRIHGVGGATPEAILGHSGVVQASGDKTAGFYRGLVPESSWSVEAYSWGGLTAHNRSRAFWVMLLPFALVNLAGWMVEPKDLHPEEGAPIRIGTRIHEILIHWTSVLLTTMCVMWVALVSMDIVAFQCGAISQCRSGGWYLEFLGGSFLVDHPGRRIVLAASLPIALLGIFWLLGYISRERYDTYGDERSAGRPSQRRASDRTSLANVEFWNLSWWHRRLTGLHIAMVLLVLGGLLGRAAAEFHSVFGGPDRLQFGSLVFAVAVTAWAVTFFVIMPWAVWRWRELLDDPDGRVSLAFRKVVSGLLVLSGVVVVAALATAWLMAVNDADLVRTADDLVEPVTGLWGFGWAPLQLLVAAIVTVLLFSSVQIIRWAIRSEVRLQQFVIVSVLMLIVLWPVAVWLAIVLLGAVAGLWVVAKLRPPAGDEEAAQLIDGVRRFAVVPLLALVTRLLTGGSAEPWGLDWPRLTPVLLFGAILTVTNLIVDRKGPSSGAADQWLPLLCNVAIAAGAAFVWVLSGRPEWLWAFAVLALVVQMVLVLAGEDYLGFRWNGASAVALFGVSLVMGLFAGGIIRLVDLLDRDGTSFRLRSTAIYEWFTIAFALFLVAGAVGLVVWCFRARLRSTTTTAERTRTWLDEVEGPRLDPLDRRRLVKSVRTWSAMSSVVRAGDVIITTFGLLMLSAMVALVMILGRDPGFDQLTAWVDSSAPADWAVVVDLSAWLVVASWFGAFLLVRSGLRDQGTRRRAGVLWDVASFWPRAFHPFAPPAYATRAVQELQRRIVETTSDGRAGTVISGHSQGSVIAFAAVASLAPAIRRRVLLVTHGSPLLRFYRRYFPQYFTDDLLLRTARSVGPGEQAINSGAWVNFWRATDPIGDPVFATRTEIAPWGYRDGVTAPAPTAQARLHDALDGCLSPLDVLPDVLLRDPVRGVVVAAEPAPTVLGHSGYMADPAVRRTIAAQVRLLLDTAGGHAPEEPAVEEPVHEQSAADETTAGEVHPAAESTTGGAEPAGDRFTPG